MFLGFLFIIPYTLIGYLCTHSHIIYIVQDLGALRVV